MGDLRTLQECLANPVQSAEFIVYASARCEDAFAQHSKKLSLTPKSPLAAKNVFCKALIAARWGCIEAVLVLISSGLNREGAK